MLTFSQYTYCLTTTKLLHEVSNHLQKFIVRDSQTAGNRFSSVIELLRLRCSLLWQQRSEESATLH